MSSSILQQQGLMYSPELNLILAQVIKIKIVNLSVIVDSTLIWKPQVIKLFNKIS